MKSTSTPHLPFIKPARIRTMSSFEELLQFPKCKKIVMNSPTSKKSQSKDSRVLKIYERKIEEIPSLISDESLNEKLKYSTNIYEDFQLLIKPPKSDLNYLCPKKELRTPISLQSPHPSNLPQKKYANYRVNSMDLLKNTDFKIKKAKEYLLIAKNLSRRY